MNSNSYVNYNRTKTVLYLLVKVMVMVNTLEGQTFQSLIVMEISNAAVRHILDEIIMKYMLYNKTERMISTDQNVSLTVVTELVRTSPYYKQIYYEKRKPQIKI
jgi:hypothetical protein